MNRPRALRADSRALSSLYGAFAVLLVSAVVVGTVLGAPARAPQDGVADGRTVDAFLDALMASTMANSTLTVGRATASACLGGACPAGALSLAALRENVSRLAFPLARALGRPFEVRVENASGPLLVLGDLPAHGQALAARADLYHAPTRGYLSVTAALGAK